jgi:hypothetical protein
MKKALAITAVILLLAGTAYAVRTINLSETKMQRFCIDVDYNEAGQAVPILTVVYEVSDPAGEFTQEEAWSVPWQNVPANIRTQLQDFLTYVDRQFRNRSVNEDNSTITFP